MNLKEQFQKLMSEMQKNIKNEEKVNQQVKKLSKNK